MGETENWKCSVKNRRVVPCDGLSQTIEGGVERRQKNGVYEMNLRNTETKRTRMFLVLKSGKHAKSGIIINFCPFCGAQIDGPANNEELNEPTEAPHG